VKGAMGYGCGECTHYTNTMNCVRDYEELAVRDGLIIGDGLIFRLTVELTMGDGLIISDGLIFRLTVELTMGDGLIIGDGLIVWLTVELTMGDGLIELIQIRMRKSYERST
jgi:hypothetical protein